MPGYVPGQSTVHMIFGSTVLSGTYRTFSATEDADLVDGSAGVDANKSFLVALKSGKASVELVDQAAGTALWTAVAPGTSGTLIWAPEGTATGKQKHSAVCLVASRDRSTPYNEVAIIKVEFQINSAVTDTVY